MGSVTLYYITLGINSSPASILVLSVDDMHARNSAFRDVLGSTFKTAEHAQPSEWGRMYMKYTKSK